MKSHARVIRILPGDGQQGETIPPESPVERQLSLSDLPLWTSSSLSALGRPEPVLPRTEEERASYIDHHALASLEPFKHHQKNRQQAGIPPDTPHDDVFQPREAILPPLWPPIIVGPEGRRHTWTSLDPTTSPFLNNTSAGYLEPSSVCLDDFQRRSSVPSARLPSINVPVPARLTESRTYAIVPRQLGRPAHPARLSQGDELWWPVQENGLVQIQVGIESRLGVLEKLSRCFSPRQLHMVISKLPSRLGTPDHEATVPLPEPGSILPVPGTRPLTSCTQHFSTDSVDTNPLTWSTMRAPTLGHRGFTRGTLTEHWIREFSNQHTY